MAATPTTQKEKVWDYPRPPRLEPTSRHLIVKLGDTVIADTTQAYRVLETSHPPTYYLPPADCKQEFFSASSKPRTLCEWKGRASYHDVTAGVLVSLCTDQLGGGRVVAARNNAVQCMQRLGPTQQI